MRIEAYFAAIRAIIEACPVDQTSNVAYDKRSTHEGFISGELYFWTDRSFTSGNSSMSRRTQTA